MDMFEFVKSERSTELTEKKKLAWEDFLKNEKAMLTLFDGTARGKVRVKEATNLLDVGVYAISQAKAKIVSRLFTSNSSQLKEMINKIQSETLSMLIEAAFTKISDSRL